MSAPHPMSTDIVAPAERAAIWREWVWTHFGGLDSDLYGDTEFDGHMSASQAGDVVLTRLEANRHRVIKSDRQARANERAYLKIVAPWRGSAGVHQAGREAWVRPGGWAIYDTTDHYAVSNPERVEHLIVMLPKAQLAERGLALEPLMARHVGGVTGIARVALETMRTTYQELPGMSEAAARGAGELIVELVRLSLLELSGKENGRTQVEAFRDRIRVHIGRHLRDPDLSLDHIANAMNCSKRHLHKAFSAEDDTLASYIQRQRIEACMRELADPMGQSRTITEIAFSWGFNNTAHFSRVFREHAGETPSAFRERSKQHRAT
ncbi:MAG: helix-turn-helix domain-containing protein [Hydrogenophaga sp.]|uniref:AraC-like ligand-binding domain-containing protein n=1 Tax=Hydrogenophaga sp. TaxID=1904254 RepID=UPI001D2D5273|nr:helix-turn-helix domain-containing protein [Hydrogenophaga sp.]MBX3608354.1 helix-turn-helix domain-containing protein [Hydrogenophaga sp.]